MSKPVCPQSAVTMTYIATINHSPVYWCPDCGVLAIASSPSVTYTPTIKGGTGLPVTASIAIDGPGPEPKKRPKRHAAKRPIYMMSHEGNEAPRRGGKRPCKGCKKYTPVEAITALGMMLDAMDPKAVAGNLAMGFNLPAEAEEELAQLLASNVPAAIVRIPHQLVKGLTDLAIELYGDDAKHRVRMAAVP